MEILTFGQPVILMEMEKMRLSIIFTIIIPFTFGIMAVTLVQEIVILVPVKSTG
jgi:type IV secretory pathway component VirB8